MDLEDKLAERDAEWADALAVVLGDLKLYRLNPLAWAEAASVKLKSLRGERDMLIGQVAEWQKKFAEVVTAKQSVVADLEAAEATLTMVNGLLDPVSIGRLPQCKLCDVCAGMLKAALRPLPRRCGVCGEQFIGDLVEASAEHRCPGEEEALAAEMAADPEFVRRVEEGYRALDEGRCTPLSEVKKKLLTNAEKIENLKAWQAAGHVHELTCGVDSRHALLVPEECDGRVVMVCPECGYTQTFIPEVCLFGPPPPPKLEG